MTCGHVLGSVNELELFNVYIGNVSDLQSAHKCWYYCYLGTLIAFESKVGWVDHQNVIGAEVHVHPETYYASPH
jgi:hypothetical protein